MDRNTFNIRKSSLGVSLRELSTMPKKLEDHFSEDEVMYLKNELKKSDTICAVVSMLGILFTIIEVLHIIRMKFFFIIIIKVLLVLI